MERNFTVSELKKACKGMQDLQIKAENGVIDFIATTGSHEPMQSENRVSKRFDGAEFNALMLYGVNTFVNLLNVLPQKAKLSFDYDTALTNPHMIEHGFYSYSVYLVVKTLKTNGALKGVTQINIHTITGKDLDPNQL